MQYKTVNEYDLKIAELKAQLGEVQGSVCEVYTRVIGYLRPVSEFNLGKKEEFKTRVNFKFSVGKLGGFSK